MKTMLIAVGGLILCAILAAGFWGSQRAAAHELESGDALQHKTEWIKTKLTGELDLTDAQVAELDRIFETVKAKHAQMHANHEDMRTVLFNELRKDQLTADDIKQVFESRRPAFEEMLTVISEGIADFHAVLTPEQREKLVADLEAHKGGCWRKHW